MGDYFSWELLHYLSLEVPDYCQCPVKFIPKPFSCEPSSLKAIFNFSENEHNDNVQTMTEGVCKGK